MSSEQRPDRYPVKLTMQNEGKGLTCPREGSHFLPVNEPFLIGVAEGSLKYWIIDGKIVKGNPIKLDITNKDVDVKAVFSEDTPPKLSLEGIEKIVEKDIKAVTDLNISREEHKGMRRNLLKAEETEK